jgi:hypothetical protein
MKRKIEARFSRFEKFRYKKAKEIQKRTRESPELELLEVWGGVSDPWPLGSMIVLSSLEARGWTTVWTE